MGVARLFGRAGLLVSAGLLISSCDRLEIPGAVPIGPVSVLNVNSTADAIDANPGDKLCADAQRRCTLRAAIMEANKLADLQTINIPAGTYVLTIAGANDREALSGDLNLNSDINLVGADAVTTIVNANELDRAFSSSSAPYSSVMTVVRAKNLTIKGGRGTGGGGGWSNTSSTLTLENMIFTDNASTTKGGGLYIDSGISNLTNVRFEGNSASDSGGGMATFSRELTVIKSSSFINNSSRGVSTSGLVGKPGGGGGLYAETEVEVSGTSFTGNSATVSAGGAILVTGRTRIKSSTFNENQAKDCGGGIFSESSDLLVDSSSLSGNSSVTGAGVCLEYGTTIIQNTTINGNKSSDAGGGLYSYLGNLSLVHATFADNVALLAGGKDIYFRGGNTSMVVRASVLASGGLACVTTSAKITSTGANVIADASCEFTGPGDVQNAIPLLGVATPIPGQVFSVRIPAASSPAVNRVPAALCLALDARGVKRPEGAACDSGAVERTGTDP